MAMTFIDPCGVAYTLTHVTDADGVAHDVYPVGYAGAWGCATHGTVGEC